MLLRRIARPLLSAAFVGQGIETLMNAQPAAEVVRPTLKGLHTLPGPVSARVPDNAATVARVNAALQIGGGLLLATGRIPRVASATLAATVIPGNLGRHMFWAETDPELKAEKRRGFLTDVSLIGGLIVAAADTAGKPSLGWRGRRAGHRVVEAVAAALPSHDTAVESELAAKIGHGLHVGAERGRELADAAIEKSIPIAETALRRGAELADAAIEKSIPIAETARRRGAELAETARDQGGEQLAAGWHRLRAQM